MSIIQIQDVQREGAKIIIMLCGVSGCGKTYTAIQLGLGMANMNPAKLGVLDTENGRAKFYADTVPAPFKYGELKPPFSPARYIQAIDAFAAAGVEVLVVDSGSHEYEGIGGIQDIAEAGNPRLPNWNKAKGEHKKFMSALLTSPMHIIFCLRAREKAKPEKQIVDGREKTVYVDMGLQPITEKNVVFEATASLMMHDQGKRQDIIKCPAALLPILGRQNDYLTAEDGQRVRAWVDGAKQLDPKVERWRASLNGNTSEGLAHIQDCWKKTPPAIRAALGEGFKAELEHAAKEFDRQRAEAGSPSTPDDPALSALNAAADAVTDEPLGRPAEQPKTAPAPVQADDDDNQF